MIALALRYATLGWRVLPLYEPISPGVCSCRKGTACGRDCGKHPRIANWANAATVDASTIRAWWSTWPQASIAIATGHGQLVVDLDGPEGEACWRALVADHEVPTTPEQSTGRGRHLFFAVDGEARTSKGALGPSIDTRGEGGYVVAAPSIHGSGRRYEWTRAPWECASAPAPAWLLDRLGGRAPCVPPDSNTQREGHNAQGGPDHSDSGEDAREALRLVRRGSTDDEIASVLRERASYVKRVARSARIAEDYLDRTLTWARAQPVLDPWGGAVRVRVVRAAFERLSAKPWAGKGAVDRVNLWVATADGEVLARQQVYLHAREVYASVLGDIPPAAWLAAADCGQSIARTLVGRELEIVMNGGPRAVRMRRVPQTPQREETKWTTG